jgi:hypothetical protein
MGESGSRDGADSARMDAGGGVPASASVGVEERLAWLMEEFRERQRRRPELVVRPWWGQGAGGRRERGSQGFVVEYCPGGVESVDVAIRRDRVRLDGPRGVRELPLDLSAGWVLDGEDRETPATLANHLLSRADGLLSGVA